MRLVMPPFQSIDLQLWGCHSVVPHTNTLKPLPEAGWGRGTEAVKCPDTCRGPGPELLKLATTRIRSGDRERLGQVESAEGIHVLWPATGSEDW